MPPSSKREPTVLSPGQASDEAMALAVAQHAKQTVMSIDLTVKAVLDKVTRLADMQLDTNRQLAEHFGHTNAVDARVDILVEAQVETNKQLSQLSKETGRALNEFSNIVTDLVKRLHKIESNHEARIAALERAALEAKIKPGKSPKTKTGH